jgi:hypothetical protein
MLRRFSIGFVRARFPSVRPFQAGTQASPACSPIARRLASFARFSRRLDEESSPTGPLGIGFVCAVFNVCVRCGIASRASLPDYNPEKR